MTDAIVEVPPIEIRKRRQGIGLVLVKFAKAGVRLTPDGDVAMRGLVHWYLARWVSQVDTGTVPRPPGWPDPAYDYVPAALSFSVLEGEARAVADTLTALLRRPGMVERLPALPGEQAARWRR
jgi:hypothetical protein